MVYLQALESIFEPMTIIFIILGTLGGIVLGAIPGLGGPIGIALLLPFTFDMEPAAALLMLGGIYMGASYGGSISSILLNTPGTAEAACTALDGYPLAQQGRGKEALNYSILSSVIGGAIGVLMLIFFTPILAKFALEFGPAEMFLIAVAGLAIVGTLSAGNVNKGIFAASFGILISFVGSDMMTGTDRLTFGIAELRAGIPLVPVIIGLFAITEMILQANHKGGSIVDKPFEKSSAFSVFKKIAKMPKTVLKSSFIGTIIGIIPGAGGAVASFISYGEAKRASKQKDLFGKGSVEGIIASESSNNAAVGGAIVPLLSLGVPGSTTTAIIFGALTIHGLIPGPRLFVDHQDIAYTFMIGMLLTVVVIGVIGVYGANLFSKVLKVKLNFIIPMVLVLSVFGAYSIRNSMMDVLIALAFGIIGIFFKKLNIPTAPIILGLILGTMAETNLRQSMTIANAQHTNIFGYLFSSPISIGILVLLFVILVSSFKSNSKS